MLDPVRTPVRIDPISWLSELNTNCELIINGLIAHSQHARQLQVSFPEYNFRIQRNN